MLQGVLRLVRIDTRLIAALVVMLVLFFGPTSAYALETDILATEETVQNGGDPSSQDPYEENERNDFAGTQGSNGTNEDPFEHDLLLEESRADSSDELEDQSDSPAQTIVQVLSEGKERSDQEGSQESNGTDEDSFVQDNLLKQNRAKVPDKLETQSDSSAQTTPQVSPADSLALRSDGLSSAKTSQPLATLSDDQKDSEEKNETTVSSQSDDSKEEPPASKEDTIAVYRLYNPHSGEHFYTLDKNERNCLSVIGWSYEGLGWMSSSSGNAVYRLYNPNEGDHHYTMSASERDHLSRIGWRYEGTAFYTPDKNNVNIVPVYRQFNPNAKCGAHNFTPSKIENDHLASIGWRAEGIAWYSYSVPADFKDDFDSWGATISGDKTLDRQIYALEQLHTTLSSCFDYVKDFRYINGTKYWSGPRVLSDDLTISLSKSMLNKKGGNCYQYASLFNWLARGLGYDSQVISGWIQSQSSGRAPHGWVEIKKDNKTYVCDPDMAHELPGYSWYMVTYDKAPITYHDW